MNEVLCLRPLSDFSQIGVSLPAGLTIREMAPDDPALAGAVQQADALVIPAVGPPLPTALFNGAGLKLVQVTGAGHDRVDVAELAARGIPVATVPGGSAEAVADYVVTTATTLLRRWSGSTAAIRTGAYVASRKQMIGDGMRQFDGLTVGLVGLGVIGRATAARCRALGAKVIHFDPAVPGPGSHDLQAVLSRADVLSLHVPLMDETRGLIGAAELAAMKPDAVLINAARGGVVDEAALAEALRAGRLGGAAVDVYSTEPPGPENPLLQVDDATAAQLILTPHIAGVTRQAWATLFNAAWANVRDVLIDGRPPAHVVGPATG